MKIVLDTNVLISGIYFSGPPSTILQAWCSRKLQLCVSLEILEEYLDVAERLANRYAGVEYEQILGLVVQNAEVVQPEHLLESICEDPDDDKFLACAFAAKAETIVSGDRDLLRVSGYRNLQIMKPKMFVRHGSTTYRLRT